MRSLAQGDTSYATLSHDRRVQSDVANAFIAHDPNIRSSDRMLANLYAYLNFFSVTTSTMSAFVSNMLSMYHRVNL
jgi:hypothetical protein